MTIDVTLTEEEINKAIYEYLNKKGLITSDFVMVKKYAWMFLNLHHLFLL